MLVNFKRGKGGSRVSNQGSKIVPKSFEMVVSPASRNCYPTNPQLVWILAFKLICVIV